MLMNNVPVDGEAGSPTMRKMCCVQRVPWQICTNTAQALKAVGKFRADAVERDVEVKLIVLFGSLPEEAQKWILSRHRSFRFSRTSAGQIRNN